MEATRFSNINNPYFSNIVYAVRFLPRKFEENKSMFRTGRAHLRTSAPKYSFLVLISGGAISALNLLNSRLFGLQMFSMDLTKKELASFQKIQFVLNMV